MTAVYRYVVTAARDRLGRDASRPDPCPACRHDDAAVGRALDTLTDGLADDQVRIRCRALGGVCVPHLAAAARSGPLRDVGWLAEVMRDILNSGQGRIGWLAGNDDDAGARARLRRMLPDPGSPTAGTCAACLLAARAERDSLALLTGLAGSASDGDPGFVLCQTHLADGVTVAASTGRERTLLSWQAACVAACARRPGGRAVLAGLRSRVRPGSGRARSCMICRAMATAVSRSLADAVSAQIPSAPAMPCVRHHRALPRADQRAAVWNHDLAAEAEVLIGQLSEAFERTTWAGRQGGPAPVSSAWLRAAAFLDGAVFGGGPPPAG
jgi:hypothetical protein